MEMDHSALILSLLESLSIRNLCWHSIWSIYVFDQISLHYSNLIRLGWKGKIILKSPKFAPTITPSPSPLMKFAVSFVVTTHYKVLLNRIEYIPSRQNDRFKFYMNASTTYLSYDCLSLQVNLKPWVAATVSCPACYVPYNWINIFGVVSFLSVF